MTDTVQHTPLSLDLCQLETDFVFFSPRFSFRAFLIRSRNVMYSIRRARIFVRWKEMTFQIDRILWRQRYYTLVLTGWKSRRRRMVRALHRWRTVFVPISRLEKKIRLNILQQLYVCEPRHLGSRTKSVSLFLFCNSLVLCIVGSCIGFVCEGS